MAEIIDVNNITSVNVTDQTLPTGDTDAIFDRLMHVSKLHIQQEYKAGRIKGREYATVYLGMLQSAMAQSVNYELSKKVQSNKAEQVEESTRNSGYSTIASMTADYGFESLEVDSTDKWKITDLVYNTRADKGTVYAKEQSTVAATTRANAENEKRLEQMDEQTNSIRTARAKTERDTLLVETQRQKMIEQVDDNKLIKGAEQLAEAIKYAMAAEVSVPANFWGELLGMIADLTRNVRTNSGQININDILSGAAPIPAPIKDDTTTTSPVGENE